MVIPGIQDFYDGMNHLVAHEMEQANQDMHPSNNSGDHSHHDSHPQTNTDETHTNVSREHEMGAHHSTKDYPDDHQTTIQSFISPIAHGVASAVLSWAAEGVMDCALSKAMLVDSDSHHQGTTPLSVGTPSGDGFTHQTTGFTCAVVSQKMILDQFHLTDPQTGEPLSEARLVYDATANGWLSDHGTSMGNLSKLLDHYGVSSHEGHDWPHLIHDLAEGHQVVMAVNADGLWNEHSPFSDLMNLFGNSANHAIVVKGLKVNDHGKVMVIVNDPGQADGAGVEYPLEHFQSAIDSTHMHYVATDHTPSDWSPGPAIQSLLTEHGFSQQPDDNPHPCFAETISMMSDQDRDTFLRDL